MLVDTHAHLTSREFGGDLARVLERAFAAGVGAIVTVSEDLDDARRGLALAERYPGRVLPAAGLFPTRLDLGECARLEDWARRHALQLAAIGEVGLDHWKVRDPGERDEQSEIFARLVDLAIELDLPLNVHSRATGRETIALLLERGARRVQMHAFDGRAATARPALEAGYFFSVPPSIVRSRQKQKLVGRLPLDSLLVETDSPVLGPLPGERNEPAHVRLALTAIAEIKGLPESDVVAAIVGNTARLYRL